MGNTFLNRAHRFSVESTVLELISYISEAQHPDGGWGQAGACSWTEPTAFAVYALASAGADGRAVDRGRAWLLRMQRADGGWPPHQAVGESTWVTAPVTIALAGLGEEGGAAKGRDWLVRQYGAELQSRPVMLGLMTRTRRVRTGAWPWFPGTAGWVTPTALSLLALEPEAHRPAIAERLAAGRAHLLSHVCADGGWNHGSPRALGYDAPSYPETTGQALVALRSETALPIGKAIEKAEADLAGCYTAQGAAWLALGLAAHGRAPRGFPRGLVVRDILDAAILLLAKLGLNGKRIF